MLGAAVLVVGGMAFYLKPIIDHAGSTPSASEPEVAPVAAAPAKAAPAKATEQEIRKWFVDHGWDAGSNYGHITKISWSSETLVFGTDLHADGDARQPAQWVCGTGAQYLAGSGLPQHVQVMDGSGSILTSRRGDGDQCAWRR